MQGHSLSFEDNNSFKKKLKVAAYPKKYSMHGTPMTAVTKGQGLPKKMPYLMHTQNSFNKGKTHTLQSDRGSVQVGAKAILTQGGMTHQTGWPGQYNVNHIDDSIHSVSRNQSQIKSEHRDDALHA